MGQRPSGISHWVIYGCGSKLNKRGYAGFGPCFHLQGSMLAPVFEPQPYGLCGCTWKELYSMVASMIRRGANVEDMDSQSLSLKGCLHCCHSTCHWESLSGGCRWCLFAFSRGVYTNEPFSESKTTLGPDLPLFRWPFRRFDLRAGSHRKGHEGRRGRVHDPLTSD